MTDAPDEVLLLAHEALQMWYWGRDEHLEFDAFLRDWRLARQDQHGALNLSLWAGPGDARVAILCETQPEWRRLTAADYSEDRFWPGSGPWHGSFLRPGAELLRGEDCFCKYGLFLGWWPAFGGAEALRLKRRDQEVTLDAGEDGFLLIDWSSSQPVQSFDALRDADGEWQKCVLPFVPCDAAALYHAYREFRANWPEDRRGSGPKVWWPYNALDGAGREFANVVVGILGHANATADHDMLIALGAHIYGNNAAFFQRLEAEMDMGRLSPDVVGLVLRAERPEFLDEESLRAFNRLYRRSYRV